MAIAVITPRISCFGQSYSFSREIVHVLLIPNGFAAG